MFPVFRNSVSHPMMIGVAGTSRISLIQRAVRNVAPPEHEVWVTLAILDENPTFGRAVVFTEQNSFGKSFPSTQCAANVTSFGCTGSPCNR